MDRRTLLAGIGSLGVLGSGGWLVFGDRGRIGGDYLEPVAIRPLDGPSSQSEPFRVPFADAVTVIDIFATWCTPCLEHVETLETVRSSVGDGIRFVSVTNQATGQDLTRADIQEWWAEHGGDWAAGFDDEGALTRRTRTNGLPHTAVVDPAGRLTWARSGTPDPEPIVAAIEEASDG